MRAILCFAAQAPQNSIRLDFSAVSITNDASYLSKIARNADSTSEQSDQERTRLAGIFLFSLATPAAVVRSHLTLTGIT